MSAPDTGLPDTGLPDTGLPDTGPTDPAPAGGAAVRVRLPTHLRAIARVDGEVRVQVTGRPTQRSVLDALEASYPGLRGTIRDPTTLQRRPFVRFFACEEDLSHEPPDAPLPGPVGTGTEPLLIVGAMAGG